MPLLRLKIIFCCNATRINANLPQKSKVAMIFFSVRITQIRIISFFILVVRSACDGQGHNASFDDKNCDGISWQFYGQQ